MVAVGARDAINLDGGGWSSLVVEGREGGGGMNFANSLAHRGPAAPGGKPSGALPATSLGGFGLPLTLRRGRTDSRWLANGVGFTGNRPG